MNPAHSRCEGGLRDNRERIVVGVSQQQSSVHFVLPGCGVAAKRKEQAAHEQIGLNKSTAMGENERRSQSARAREME